jgi:CBS domain-containing protein
MTPNPVVVPGHVSLRTAAHLLAQARVTGAPVIDERGVCVGVLSATDFMRYAEGHSISPAQETSDGSCVCADWQMVELEQLPAEEVTNYMSRDLQVASPRTGITDLARMMVAGHIHRLIVVDEGDRPVGIITTMDILAALAAHATEEICL